MPIYEYRRPDGTTFEVLQSFSDASLQTDPQTGVPVERVLHAPAVHFKGKGFYNTDYGTRKRQRETGASSDGAKEPTSESSAAGESSSSSNGAAPSASPEKKEAPAAKTEKLAASSAG